MEDQIRISICVPACNEQVTLRASVEGLISVLSGRVACFEVIVVNDGSADSTASIADELARRYPQVRVIHHRLNKGIGASYRDALAVARYDYFTWFPADLENGPEELLNCLPYLGLDRVIVNNYRASDRRPFSRRLLSRIYVAAINAVFRQRITYYNGLNIVPVKILRSVPLIANGFIFNAETVIRSIRAGCSVIELSHALRPRTGGQSKLISVRAFAQMTRDIVLLVNHYVRNAGGCDDQKSQCRN